MTTILRDTLLIQTVGASQAVDTISRFLGTCPSPLHNAWTHECDGVVLCVPLCHNRSVVLNWLSLNEAHQAPSQLSAVQSNTPREA